MVLTYYDPHWTGLTAYARRLAEGLVRRGHQIAVLTSQCRRELPKEEMHNGVRTPRPKRLMCISRRCCRRSIRHSFLGDVVM